MINVAKSVKTLASMTADLQALVDMADKVNSIDQYEADMQAKVKELEAKAVEYRELADKAKGELDEALQGADKVRTQADADAAEHVRQAQLKASEIIETAEREADDKLRDAQSRLVEIQQSVANAETTLDELADKVGKEQARLDSIKAAISKYTE